MSTKFRFITTWCINIKALYIMYCSMRLYVSTLAAICRTKKAYWNNLPSLKSDKFPILVLSLFMCILHIRCLIAKSIRKAAQHMQCVIFCTYGMVWYGNLISPGEAFSHEATSQGTQSSTDTSSKFNLHREIKEFKSDQPWWYTHTWVQYC